MTASTDTPLVERLRTSDGFKVSKADDGLPYIHADEDLLAEAAARIEQLEKIQGELIDACGLALSYNHVPHVTDALRNAINKAVES